LEYKSGAVFHGKKNKMIGTLHGDEMKWLEMLENEYSSQLIEFPYEGKTSVIRIIRSNNDVTVYPKNKNDINVKIDIEIEGVLEGMFRQGDLENSSEINNLQESISNEVKKNIEKVIKKSQQEFGTDIFKVWQELETKHYDTWKKVKDDWEKGEYYFNDVNFDVNITTEIHSTGATNKAK